MDGGRDLVGEEAKVDLGDNAFGGRVEGAMWRPNGTRFALGARAWKEPWNSDCGKEDPR
jgi:hypothetical protein